MTTNGIKATPISGGRTFRCVIAIRKHLTATRRFKGVIVHAGDSNDVLEVGSITHVRLSTGGCSFVTHSNSRRSTTMTFSLASSTGTVSAVGGVGTGLTRSDGSFPTSVACHVSVSGASFVCTSIGRILRAFFRTLLVMTVVICVFLRG